MAPRKARVAEAPISTGEKSDDPRSKTWFKPGNCANPNGRPKGSRNALGEDFLSKLQEDFKEHGIAAIQKVRTDRPHEYLKVVASILPKEINVRTTAVEEMSDDDLAAGIAALQSVLAAQAAGARGDPETKH